MDIPHCVYTAFYFYVNLGRKGIRAMLVLPVQEQATLLHFLIQILFLCLSQASQFSLGGLCSFAVDFLSRNLIFCCYWNRIFSSHRLSICRWYNGKLLIFLYIHLTLGYLLELLLVLIISQLSLLNFLGLQWYLMITLSPLLRMILIPFSYSCDL